MPLSWCLAGQLSSTFEWDAASKEKGAGICVLT